MKRLVIPLILLVAAGVGLWWWTGSGDDPALSPAPAGNAAVQGARRPVAVTVAPVEVRDIRETVRFTGSLTAASRVEITPRVAGRLDRIYVDIGDTVRRGDRLASLDTDVFEQELEQARAELAVARASLAEARASLAAAERSLARTRELREQRVASQAELEAAETEVQAQLARLALARAQIEQREAALRGATIRLSYTELRASWEGEAGERLVAERYADEGAILQANSSILALVDPDPLKALVFVTERDYARLQPGQQATLTTEAYPGERFFGEVARLAPEFREASRQARVEIRVPNADDRLKPGMFVEVRVATRQLTGVTVVPLDAVVMREGETGVFHVRPEEDGPRARFLRVETGLEDGDRVEIRRPAALTGEVVVLGHHLLSDGARLRPGDAAGAEPRAARR
jgi:RND family efflux transporter MFP subunit